MADVRIVISDDLLQMEAWQPQPAGFPAKPHREKYELQQAGDVSWLVAWMDDRPCGSVTITWPESSGEHTEQGRSLGCAEIGGLGVENLISHRVRVRPLVAVPNVLRPHLVTELEVHNIDR